jgi:hypothetical protein
MIILPDDHIPHTTQKNLFQTLWRKSKKECAGEKDNSIMPPGEGGIKTQRAQTAEGRTVEHLNLAHSDK